MQNYNDQSAAYDFYREVSIPARKNFSQFAISLLAYALVSYMVILAAQIILIFALGEEGAQGVVENVYVQWLLNVVPTYMIALPVLYAIVRRMPTKALKKAKIGIGEFVLLFFAAQAVMTVGNLLGVTLNGVIGAIMGKEISNATSELISASPVWIITLVAVVIGPVVEEFIFRKLMIDRLSRYGNICAIIVSGVAFGLFHGNLYQFFYAALLGILLGYLYVRTGNWLYPVAMHMLINLFGSVLTLPVLEASEVLTEMQALLAEGTEINLIEYYKSLILVASYSMISYGMAVAGAVILYKAFKNKAIRIESDCEIYLPRRNCAKAVLFNVGVILYILFSLVCFTLSILS